MTDLSQSDGAMDQPESQSESQSINQPDNRPTIETSRLILRPFYLSDVDRMHGLINDREIASNTRTIEYPYPDGAAELWIKQHPGFWQKGDAAVFAICLKDPEGDSSILVGAIGLEICKTNHHAELGYWIGRAYWGQGICSQAARRVIQFGFQQLGLYKIHAHHLTRNPASGRVLEKAGMIQEGLFRGHVRKWGVFEDAAMYGVLAAEFDYEDTEG